MHHIIEEVLSEYCLADAKGIELRVTTAAQPVRFLLIAGKPLGDPVAWQGPIVINARQELETAFREYQAGSFIHAKKS